MVTYPGFQATKPWLIATALVCAAVPLSISFVDLPVVHLALGLIPARGVLTKAPVDLPIMPVLALAGILTGTAFVISKRPMPHWGKAALTAGVAVALSLCLIEFALKPLFGRSLPTEYLAYGTYTFDWFHGRLMLGSFPSGHSAQAASILSVLWAFYPRGRLIWASAFAVLATILVIGQWHYISDIIAGGYIGVAVGILTLRFIPAMGYRASC